MSGNGGSNNAVVAALSQATAEADQGSVVLGVCTHLQAVIQCLGMAGQAAMDKWGVQVQMVTMELASSAAFLAGLAQELEQARDRVAAGGGL